MNRIWTLILFAGILAVASPALAADKFPLRVLYLGNDPDRIAAFEEFLESKFVSVSTSTHDGFDRSVLKEREIDVVLLDWSQREAYSFSSPSSRDDLFAVNGECPLGDRDEWTTPVVLLGSAGHLLAGFWEVVGGSG